MEHGIEGAARLRVEIGDERRQARNETGLPPHPRPTTGKVTFRKNGTGRYVVVGPTELLRPKTTVQAVNVTTGRIREVFVNHVGKPFWLDGIEQCYGYIAR